MTIIAIVGAGLAGLRAAYTLEQLGYSPFIFEASERIGGRVKSDTIDGFILDHGFQVILSSANEIFSILNKKELELGFFPSGAMIQHNGEWISVLNPIRDPEKLVFGKEAFFFDFLKLSRLYLKQKMQSDQRSKADPNPLSSWDLLKKSALSESFIEEMIRPLFGAIFFDQGLFTSSTAFLRTLPLFIEGKAGLPKKGIQALAAVLAQKLTRTQIRLKTKVQKIEKGKLHLSANEIFDADWIILATDLESAKQFIPPLADSKTVPSTCLYFSIDARLIEPVPFLYLNPDKNKPINHFCFCNLTQLSYAPSGKMLLSATVVNRVAGQDPKLTELAAEQLSSYFHIDKTNWQHIKTYTIPHSLPDLSRPPFYHGKYRFDREKRIYLCGETVDLPSFNDALASGRKVAEVLHEDIQNSNINN